MAPWTRVNREGFEKSDILLPIRGNKGWPLGQGSTVRILKKGISCIEYSYQLEEIKVDPLDKGQPLGFLQRSILLQKVGPFRKGRLKIPAKNRHREDILFPVTYVIISFIFVQVRFP